MAAVDLPEEIWRLIADEIVEATFCKEFPYRLMGVNRAFFNYYLDMVYGEVYWAKLDHDTVWQLERLQNPIIASHVKRLRIHAWFIDYLMSRDALARPPSRFKRLLQFIRRRPAPSSSSTLESSEVQFAKSFSKNKLVNGSGSSYKPIITAMRTAIGHMTSVTTYTFELRDLPLTKDTELFLVAARLSFGSTLRKLVLHTAISKFDSVLQHTGFEFLDELELHFDYAAGVPSKEEESALLENVVPFINSRCSSIRTLSISSCSAADLSPFFSSLDDFRSLRSLSLYIFYDEAHLSDPSSLLNLIRPRLHHVDFKIRTPESESFKNKETLFQTRMESWKPVNTHLLSHRLLFASIESLHIPFLSLEATLPLISSSSRSLSRLSLYDTKLSFGELTGVMDALGESGRAFGVRFLHVEVKELTVGCLKMLAGRLPRLESLVLIYDVVDLPELAFRWT
ncbi:hypothetical protein CC1G_02716 [Coprinopsis cinerea okayama7|uniref:F-box domain-containing protein n=1 Tax=Coprinopsis cinerea (strain Okayama-7 / 130 / ATCC MYA-4618 / FGSC 9003) TaxID=240176 RepID=A8PBR7_COPC7|nr:hypothetical protein CC1G_02716 [Coprinopsis cinerea okayama7\|eukprot:XP_001840253.2 hypothetical protein CC1G_02716 [Coprinopsis cinerea okayama7\